MISRTNINPTTGMETPEMERRAFLRIGGFGLGSLALTGGIVGIAVTETGCGGNVFTWADQVVGAFTDALPIFQDILPGSVKLLTQALAVAKDLRDALKNKSTNALDLIKQLIAPDGLFNKILADLNVAQSSDQKKIVQGIILIAGIALRLISSGLQQGAKAVPALAKAARSTHPAAVGLVERVAESNAIEQALAAVKF